MVGGSGASGTRVTCLFLHVAQSRCVSRNLIAPSGRFAIYRRPRVSRRCYQGEEIISNGGTWKSHGKTPVAFDFLFIEVRRQGVVILPHGPYIKDLPKMDNESRIPNGDVGNPSDLRITSRRATGALQPRPDVGFQSRIYRRRV